ncbi:MAG: multicopper oxidase domain-containing protein [Bdellovibrionales bacterium]|nr:multicopper oxidase domain-containing protein [Bdellovibrionales bacterium]
MIIFFVFQNISAQEYLDYQQSIHQNQSGKEVQEDQKTVANINSPKTVRYDLHIHPMNVNFSGKTKKAIGVNGQLPMPTLTFTEGDMAEIHVFNDLDEDTSLHWHGLFLPNRYDGVPNLTQLPIPPHSEHVYRFPIVQHGTHWYHSHSRLQEQIGMYGAMVLLKRDEPAIPTIPVVISEWTDVKPQEVDRRLHSASDWFGIQKGSTQSYWEAIRHGHFWTKIINEWKRMSAMDVSDVYYDTFLINGKNQVQYHDFKSGDRVRLRLINAGASDNFWLTYAGGKITVVASDGNDVVPVDVDRLLITVSETYDVIVEIPENKSFEFLITPEDRTKSASLWLGIGQKVFAQNLPRLKYFEGMKMMNGMMDVSGNMKPMHEMKMQNQQMDMNRVMYPEIEKGKIVTLNYGMLRSPESTVLPTGSVRELHFELTGNMNRYVWTLNNRTISESEKILIKKGENLRITIYNNSMMRHPMHLHGHDFRLINKHGDFSPMKNVIDIMPMETDVIEFAANAEGDWFFHCHILYHMMSGMGRIFHYEDSPPNPDLPNPESALKKLYKEDQMFHAMATIGIESNGSDGEAMLANTRWKMGTLWHLGFHDMHGYESETTLGRYLGKMQWWYPYVGFDLHYKKPGGPGNIFGDESQTWFGQKSNKDNRKTAVMGLQYILPMLFVADLRLDSDAKLRFQLGREDISISKRLRMNLMLNTDKEYMAGFRYILSKYISASTHYDSDMGWGLGMTLTY